MLPRPQNPWMHMLLLVTLVTAILTFDKSEAFSVENAGTLASGRAHTTASLLSPLAEEEGSELKTEVGSTGGATTGAVLNAGDVITLKGGRDNKYCADEGNTVKCNRNAVDGWVKFTVIDAGGGKVGLRGGKDKKICADEGNVITCNRNAIGQWEKFEVATLSGGKLSLKGGKDNKYCADEGNTVKCNRGAVGGWEKFTLKVISAALTAGEYTTFKGTAGNSAACQSICVKTGTMPTDALGYKPSAATGFCYTDNAKTSLKPTNPINALQNSDTKTRPWGECGGCPPGKYKGSGSSSCSGTCDVGCLTCFDSMKGRPGTWIIFPGGRTEGRIGSNVRSCTTCKNPRFLLYGPAVGPDFPVAECGATGTRLTARTKPTQVLPPLPGGYMLTKTGNSYSTIHHNDFWRHTGVNYMNSWAVKCQVQKMIRCVAGHQGRQTCYVRKQANCVRACQVRVAASQMDTIAKQKAYVDAGGSHCYEDCIDKSRSDKSIKANGYRDIPDIGPQYRAMQGKSGPVVPQTTWCKETLAGF